jgi:predicted rRNA pseudouridine synthase
MEDINLLINFGIINIDKPTGPTSFSITEFVRQKLNLNKASHMGTLDPKVTGVLPITLGRACRLSEYFMHHNKSYIGVLHTHKEQNFSELQGIINKKFLGKIKQIPPHKSSVKRAERERIVYRFDLLENSENKKDFLFYCEVEGGTYIRKICSDLGEIIGGAHMAELRRTQAGIFNESKISNLYEFEEAVEEYKKANPHPLKKMIVSAEESIKKVLPHVKVKEEAVKSLHTGKPLFKKDVLENIEIKEESFAAFCKEKFVGIYKKSNEKDVLGKPEFVFN